MSSFWNVIYGIVLILVWIIAAGFITEASVKLHSSRNKDQYLNLAYWYTFSVAITVWLLVALFIFLIGFSAAGIAAMFGGAAAASADIATLQAAGVDTSSIGAGISWFTLIFLFIALGLTAATGALAAVAAANMAKSDHYNPNNAFLKKAYDDCIIAASMSLVAAGLLVIGMIVYFSLGIVNQNKAKKMVEELKEEQGPEAETQPEEA